MGSENIRLGAPTTITIDGTSIGLIDKGGVEFMPANVSEVTVRSAGRTGRTKVFTSIRDWDAKFTLQEATLENLLLIYGFNTTITGSNPRVLAAVEQVLKTPRTFVFTGLGPDGKTWTVTCTAVVGPTGSLKFSDTEITAIEVTLLVLDVAGGSSTPFTISEATTVTTAPAYTVAPVDGATDVAVDAVIVWTVSNSIALAAHTVNTTNVFLAKADGSEQIAASVSYNSTLHTVTLTPDADLTASTTYTAVITSNVLSAHGVAGPTMVTDFTTASS